MQALCKTLFFTSGAVFLLVLVFLWSALHFDLLSLNHFINDLISYRFVGYTLPEALNIKADWEVGEGVRQMKILFTGIIGAGSLYLIFISYLPCFRLQMKFLSFALSLPLFVLLFAFWERLMQDDKVILSQEKGGLFLFTVSLYSVAVFCLWYCFKRPSSPLRAKSKTDTSGAKQTKDRESKMPDAQVFADNPTEAPEQTLPAAADTIEESPQIEAAQVPTEKTDDETFGDPEQPPANPEEGEEQSKPLAEPKEEAIEQISGETADEPDLPQVSASNDEVELSDEQSYGSEDSLSGEEKQISDSPSVAGESENPADLLQETGAKPS